MIVYLQILMPWIQNGYTEPFGLHLLALLGAYVALLPLYLRSRNDELYVEVWVARCVASRLRLWQELAIENKRHGCKTVPLIVANNTRQIYAYAVPVAWLLGLAEAYQADYLEAISFDLSGGVSSSKIAIGPMPLVVMLLWCMRVFLTITIGESAARYVSNEPTLRTLHVAFSSRSTSIHVGGLRSFPFNMAVIAHDSFVSEMS
jgi:hypothetical protein